MVDTSVTDSLARTRFGPSAPQDLFHHSPPKSWAFFFSQGHVERVTWSSDDTLMLYQYCVEEVEASGELSEESYRLIQQKMCDQGATYDVKNIKEKINRSRDSQDYNLRCRHHLDLLDILFDQVKPFKSNISFLKFCAFRLINSCCLS
uniref:Uncharacterized protein n=1 Tax=Oryza glumipatula TaxID=40148 RepID=A0A0E0BE41_9ORYZ